MFTDVCYTEQYKLFMQNPFQPGSCLPVFTSVPPCPMGCAKGGIPAPSSKSYLWAEIDTAHREEQDSACKAHGEVSPPFLQMHVFACIHFAFFLVLLCATIVFLWWGISACLKDQTEDSGESILDALFLLLSLYL